MTIIQKTVQEIVVRNSEAKNPHRQVSVAVEQYEQSNTILRWPQPTARAVALPGILITQTA
jgi:hypothetical protein